MKAVITTLFSLLLLYSAANVIYNISSMREISIEASFIGSGAHEAFEVPLKNNLSTEQVINMSCSEPAEKHGKDSDWYHACSDYVEQSYTRYKDPRFRKHYLRIISPSTGLKAIVERDMLPWSYYYDKESEWLLNESKIEITPNIKRFMEANKNKEG